MGDVENVVGKFADGALLDFAKAAGAVTAFVAAGTIALAKFTSDMGQTAINNEIFARQMWMSVDAAVAFRNSMSALGTNLQNLYLSPTLMNQFLALQKQSAQMMPPGFDQAMQGAQNLTFQFDRLKLEGEYAMYWVGMYITKYLAGPMSNAEGWLSKINDEITKDMPVWTKNVAMVFSDFERMANAIGMIGTGIEDIWNELGPATKEVVGIMSGAGAAIMVLSNPITAMIAGLAFLLLMLDDFYGYEHGQQSEFPGLWSWVDQMNAKLQKTGAISDFSAAIERISVALIGPPGSKDGGLLGAIEQVVGAITGLTNKQSTITTFVNAITTPLKSLSEILTAIAGAINIISGAGHGVASGVDQMTGDKKGQALNDKQGQQLTQQGIGQLGGNWIENIIKQVHSHPLTNPSSSHNTNISMPLTINIDGGSSQTAQQIGQEAAKAVKTVTNSAIRYLQGVFG